MINTIVENVKLKNKLEKDIKEVGFEICEELEKAFKEDGINSFRKINTTTPGLLHFMVCDVEVRVTYNDILRRFADTSIQIEPKSASKKDIKDAMLFIIKKRTEVLD